MARLGEEQVMVVDGIGSEARLDPPDRAAGRGHGGRTALPAAEAGGPAAGGRRNRQPTGVDGYEDAIQAILEQLGDGRLTGKGRPLQARQVYEILTREYGYTGSYRAVALPPAGTSACRRYGR